MPKPLLLVLNPRRIRECVDAITSLPIDKAWLENYTETELCSIVPRVLAETTHDPIGVISDDAAPTAEALSAVLSITTPDTVSTGYCTLDESSDLTNLSMVELPRPDPTVESYAFPPLSVIKDASTTRFRTYFAGHTLTFMPRSMWDRFPWMVYGPEPGCASDYMLSWRLQEAGIPIYAHPAAYVRHVKSRFNTLDDTPGRELRIGKDPARVRYQSSTTSYTS